MPHADRPTDRPKRQRPRGPRRCIYATFRLPLELVEELRDFVVFEARRGVRTTMAATVEAGLHEQLDRWRTLLNDGHRFPPREGGVGRS